MYNLGVGVLACVDIDYKGFAVVGIIFWPKRHKMISEDLIRLPCWADHWYSQHSPYHEQMIRIKEKHQLDFHFSMR